MKILLLALIISIASIFVVANGSHEELQEGKRLVESGAKCETLKDEEFEAIGEYLMEQMHPDEAHDQMHKMMGMEEGTEYHEQFHVNMAQMMYCGTGAQGMMGMMQMMGGGMMGPWAGGWGFGSVLWTIIVIGLAVLIWLWVIKLWRDLFARKH